MIPEFKEDGDLPVGIYQSTLSEILDRFGKGSAQRQTVARRLERIHRLAHETGFLARLVIFGSFITDKEAPNDVDVVIIMEDAFDPDQ